LYPSSRGEGSRFFIRSGDGETQAISPSPSRILQIRRDMKAPPRAAAGPTHANLLSRAHARKGRGAGEEAARRQLPPQSASSVGEETTSATLARPCLALVPAEKLAAAATGGDPRRCHGHRALPPHLTCVTVGGELLSVVIRRGSAPVRPHLRPPRRGGRQGARFGGSAPQLVVIHYAGEGSPSWTLTSTRATVVRLELPATTLHRPAAAPPVLGAEREQRSSGGR
jgi:hypothetical protein